MRILYTSYFGRLKALKELITEKDLTVASIARYSPKGIDIEQYFRLAPPQMLLSDYKAGHVSIAGYTERYMAYIKTWTPEELASQIPDRILLLCYEKAGDFCHRHLLAEYLKGQFDEVKEV
jgi:uncharacterized protein YeaO (DUF488 family)